MHGYISVYSVLWCIEWCSLEVSFCPLAFVLLEHLLDLLQYAQTKRKKGTLSTFQNKNESKSMLHHITQWKSKMTFCGPLKWKLLKTVLISTLITSNDPPHKIQVISKGTVDICSYRVHNGSGHNDAFFREQLKTAGCRDAWERCWVKFKSVQSFGCSPTIFLNFLIREFMLNKTCKGLDKNWKTCLIKWMIKEFCPFWQRQECSF